MRLPEYIDPRIQTFRLFSELQPPYDELHTLVMRARTRTARKIQQGNEQRDQAGGAARATG